MTDALKLLAFDQTAREEAFGALQKARAKHGPMASAHEGYAVLLEEVEELWKEVKRQERDPAAMRKEALHCAAMALRFIVDVCDVPAAPPEGQVK